VDPKAGALHLSPDLEIVSGCPFVKKVLEND
jgi:hypothetical protein